jgi:hypothetical protein
MQNCEQLYLLTELVCKICYYLRVSYRNSITNSSNCKIAASPLLFMVSSGRVSKIYAGKTKQSEVRIYLPGTARESGVYFLRPHLGVHVAGAGISLRLNCPETRSFEVSSRHFGPRRDFGRVRAGTARASKFVPAATALSAAVLLTQFAKITKASGRPAQAISWWCFFSLAL